MLSSSDPLSNQTGKGVSSLEYLVDFVASIAGNVIGYLVAKWLDRRKKIALTTSPYKNPGGTSSRVFVFCV